MVYHAICAFDLLLAYTRKEDVLHTMCGSCSSLSWSDHRSDNPVAHPSSMVPTPFILNYLCPKRKKRNRRSTHPGDKKRKPSCPILTLAGTPRLQMGSI